MRTVHDPFLGKDVQISNSLVDRLRGKYANGPTLPNGEPEFGWRQFPATPIQEAAADEIERLRKALGIFLGYDERFRVAVGGNPIAVEKMMEEARALVGLPKESE
jgi:hypothetical protein